MYQQSCVDIASSAGHTYERLFNKEAMVAVGYSGSSYHAQAFCAEDGMVRWLTVTFAKDYHYGCVAILVVDAPRELDRVETYMTLEEFDKLYNHYRRGS